MYGGARPAGTPQQWTTVRFSETISKIYWEVGFILFYTTFGILVSASHNLMDLDPQISMVGASEAISGVLGVFTVVHKSPGADPGIPRVLYHSDQHFYGDPVAAGLYCIGEQPYLPSQKALASPGRFILQDSWPGWA